MPLSLSFYSYLPLPRSLSLLYVLLVAMRGGRRSRVMSCLSLCHGSLGALAADTAHGSVAELAPQSAGGIAPVTDAGGEGEEAAGGGPQLKRLRLRAKSSRPFAFADAALAAAMSTGVAAPLGGVSAAAAAATSSASGRSSAGFRVKQRHDDYLVVSGVLDAAMSVSLEAFLRRKRPQPAKMKNEGGDSDDERKTRYDDRDSLVSWFDCQKECDWLHQRLVLLLQDVGNPEFRLLGADAKGQLQCECELTQYAVYGAKQHFQAWHQDAYVQGHDTEDSRQLTVVLMLSDRSDYTGGIFQVKLPPPSGLEGRKLVRTLRLDKGDAVVFPAKRLVHRVTAVETGTRKTLVYWAGDPQSCKHGRGEV